MNIFNENEYIEPIPDIDIIVKCPVCKQPSHCHDTCEIISCYCGVDYVVRVIFVVNKVEPEDWIMESYQYRKAPNPLCDICYGSGITLIRDYRDLSKKQQDCFCLSRENCEKFGPLHENDRMKNMDEWFARESLLKQHRKERKQIMLDNLAEIFAENALKNELLKQHREEIENTKNAITEHFDKDK